MKQNCIETYILILDFANKKEYKKEPKTHEVLLMLAVTGI